MEGESDETAQAEVRKGQERKYAQDIYKYRMQQFNETYAGGRAGGGGCVFQTDTPHGRAIKRDRPMMICTEGKARRPHALIYPPSCHALPNTWFGFPKALDNIIFSYLYVSITHL